MHVISERALRLFWARYPAAEGPLRAWHRIAEQADWNTFADVRAHYASADQVGKFTVFNIGGNKFRLIVAIHFNRGRVYIRHVLTHQEYDAETWKRDQPTGDPSHGKVPRKRGPKPSPRKAAPQQGERKKGPKKG